jgi:hypothetical protein
MTRSSDARILFVIALTTMALSACKDQGAPAAHPAPSVPRPPLVSSREGSAPPPIVLPLPPVEKDAGTGDAALAWTAPSGWVEEPPSSPMRRAQYKVPGPRGDGECAVFYFGPGQGGDPMSNADRWADQFTLADGSPARSAMTTSELTVNGLKVVIVEVAGTYKGGMTMNAAPATPKAGYRLLGAVAPGPDANWFFKLTGPDNTVTAQHDAFVAMVRSLRAGASHP